MNAAIVEETPVAAPRRAHAARATATFSFSSHSLLSSSPALQIVRLAVVENEFGVEEELGGASTPEAEGKDDVILTAGHRGPRIEGGQLAANLGLAHRLRSDVDLVAEDALVEVLGADGRKGVETETQLGRDGGGEGGVGGRESPGQEARTSARVLPVRRRRKPGLAELGILAG